MASQIGAPPDLSDADKVYISTELDSALNSRILYSLLLGLYTGIVAVTLGSIYTNKTRPVGRGMIVVIFLLHIVTSVDFITDWVYIRTIFVGNGQSSWAEYLFYNSNRVKLTVVMGVAGIICTVLADTTLIWRCWMVWGRRWPVILPPTLFLICTIVFKSIATYKAYATISGYTLGFVLYSAFILATTLWCTLLIIYRIVTVVRAGAQAGLGGLGAYRHVIEVFVESSALYSLSLIVYVAVFCYDTPAGAYIDVVAGVARGIAPTLLVGRVAAGHARPDDSWQGGIMSSLHFSTRLGGQRSQQESSATSDDPEAQSERGDEYGRCTVVASITDSDDSLTHQDHREIQPKTRSVDDSNTVIIVSKD
ncbi:uncharacterized protein EV420DRAFT_1709344 [Desarmillaria tabescens]|uniref:Uncharacterized protein n=1 Tax=Armillaria tabescens TaxID=1929756 RepID=A0AA39NI33_ARMTA|nr:uncharacterized protein EV420DRAFT_1709344 [Desarmillaria tabescens]KAK0465934.1 hypothetical protein EV420DRAFT_1709344 [Desarmillaria tabescens]